jgi:hypothetical protein
MAERSRGSEKAGEESHAKRPTVVGDARWRVAERRASALKVDIWKLVEELSSRSTAWRTRVSGATPQLMTKIEARVTELEKEKGLDQRMALLEEWNKVGADLLSLADDVHFKQAIEGARRVLDAGKRLQEAVAAFQEK